MNKLKTADTKPIKVALKKDKTINDKRIINRTYS